jgi:hypothetical protein
VTKEWPTDPKKKQERVDKMRKTLNDNRAKRKAQRKKWDEEGKK